MSLSRPLRLTALALLLGAALSTQVQAQVAERANTPYLTQGDAAARSARVSAE